VEKIGAHSSKSIDFDLRQLQIFRCVVELGSFSKAAEAVYLAQASVSGRIATLEDMVGVRLLDRLGRTVVPTKAGEILYKHAVLLLEMKKTASLEMLAFLGLKEGEISLGGSTIPGEYILPKMICRFREQFPRITVTLIIGDTHDIEERVLEGEIELAVVGSKCSEADLTCHELWRDELVLAIPLDHPWAHREEVALEELPTEPFILREPGSATLLTMEGYLASIGLDTLQVVARLGTSSAVKEGIKAGLGVSILSSRALETEVETGILKALRIKGIPMVRRFFLIKNRRRTASPLCHALFDFLIASAREQK
jgi:DNA-binding transcriptional LysR family regulator